MPRLNIHSSHQREARRTFWTLGWFGLFMLLVLWAPTPDGIRGMGNYLSLHMALETCAIVVACLVFAVGWHTPRQQTARNHLLLACAFLGVAVLDFSHVLSYPGMPDYITPSHVDKSIHFWQAARALAALALLAVAWLPWRTLINHRQARSLLVGVALLVLLLHGLCLFWLDQLPRMFVPGQGLTLYKVGVEYGLIALYLLSAVLFARQLRAPRTFNTSGLMAAALMMAMSEFFFTLYADVTDAYNLTGHIYKVVAYVFLYRALFIETVLQPYEKLRLSQSQLLATLEALPDLLFELDAQGNYVQAHSRQEGRLAAPSDELLGKNIRDVMPAAAAQTCMQALQEALRTGTSHGQQIELDVPEGHRWFELSVARKPGLSGADGALSHLLVISRDVTERVLFERALQQEMRLNEALLGLQKQAESSNDEQLLRHVLAQAQIITGSALGFAGWVRSDQSEVSHWVATGQDLAATINAETAAWPMAGLPLWRQAARRGEPMRFNEWTNPSPSQNQPGCPAVVQRWIGVPTSDAGQLRLLAAVANKPVPYTDADLQALRLLFDAVWRLLQKGYAERDLQARQEEIASFLSANLDLFCIGNTRGEFTRMNPGWEQVLGWSAAELTGHHFMDYVHPDDQKLTRLALDRLLSQSGPVDLENRLRCRDGSYRHIGWRAIAKGDTVYASARDITQRIADELLMSRLTQAVSQNPNPIMVTDLDVNIVYVNEAFTTCSGYTAREVLGRNPRLLASGNTPKATYREMWRQLRLGQPWQGELFNQRKNGEPYVEQALIYPVRDPSGQIRNYLAHKEDITARKAASERIKQLSNYDQLTGLPNRELLRERFRYAESLARRDAEPMTLIWLNLDNFKDINDAIGHAAGDMVLREVAQRVRALVKDQDTLSRQSGDDFVLLLGGADQIQAAQVASQMLQTLAQPLWVEQQELTITASLGVALYPSDGESLDALLRCSEAAMYRVKQSGRNGYRFFAPDMQESSTRALTLSSAIRHALAHNELRLVYQPQLSLASGRLVGAEALLRWQHPKLGAISPAEFVPLAEMSGAIIPLGDWVICEALRQLKSWKASGLPLVKVAVNLSALQFAQPGLAATLAQWMAESGIASGMLELELTEAVAMKNPAQATQTMEELSQQGFKLSIDDFGTGYSSLSYLKGFAVYKLKIDQSFVRDVERDTDDQAIVKAIIQMAHSLELITIAEGVETETQLDFLKMHGCDEVQGYHYSRPLEAQDFEAFLKSHG